MKSSIYLIAMVLLGLAIHLTHRHDAALAAPVPAQATKTQRPTAPPPATAREVLTMGPAEWRSRFDQNPTAIAPQTRKSIIRLAAELQEILAAGADPQGADVRIHVDAILTLLDSHGDECVRYF